uniref:Centrosomal protein of 55 kDa n=1 Tax=Maylandia zebra TaxID=106582 RepID=A0A3P9DS69_9CICH
MAASKYKRSLKKKLNSELAMVVSSLRKENAYLKRTLAELTHQQSQHNKLVERFLSLEAIRLECTREFRTKHEKTASPSEQLCEKEKRPVDADSTADEQVSTSNEAVAEVQIHLRDALEKNKQWLEYDQQREAYVRAILARMLWLEKQLNEANQARSQQHNEDHSDEKEKISQMQEHYERLLQKAKDELEVLRERVEVTHQNLMITQNWCKEREREVEELKQQLQAERLSRSTQEVQNCPEDEEQQQRDVREVLQGVLDDERRRSGNSELQREKPDQSSGETNPPLSQFSRPSLTSSPHSNLMNESFLECPVCQAEYPVSHHRELMNHLEICLN